MILFYCSVPCIDVIRRGLCVRESHPGHVFGDMNLIGGAGVLYGAGVI